MDCSWKLKKPECTGINYVKNNGAANSTWMSRNMIWSGGFYSVFPNHSFLGFSGFLKS